MQCPSCSSESTRLLKATTALGYRRFRCGDCTTRFNERTGTPFNFLEYPTDVVLLVVLWRLRYKLSVRDLAEMFLDRGIEFTHETVRDWEARFAPLVAEKLRRRRKGRSGPSWYADETYVKVKGRWCYLYRAIDADGNLVDCRLSEHRDMDAAQRFFRKARDLSGRPPERVTTDGHDSYPRAIREELGEGVRHRVSEYLQSFTEQSHRPIKYRYYPMLGFGSFESASRFCCAFEEVHDFFRPAGYRCASISLSRRRRIHRQRARMFKELMLAA